MHQIQLSIEDSSADVLLATMLPYAQTGELEFKQPTTRGGELFSEIVFAFVTNIGASYLYDALKSLVKKKPRTQIKIMIKDDVVEVDVDSLADRELFIERQKDITAIKIIRHA